MIKVCRISHPVGSSGRSPVRVKAPTARIKRMRKRRSDIRTERIGGGIEIEIEKSGLGLGPGIEKSVIETGIGIGIADETGTEAGTAIVPFFQ